MRLRFLPNSSSTITSNWSRLGNAEIKGACSSWRWTDVSSFKLGELELDDVDGEVGGETSNLRNLRISLRTASNRVRPSGDCLSKRITSIAFCACPTFIERIDSSISRRNITSEN